MATMQVLSVGELSPEQLEIGQYRYSQICHQRLLPIMRMDQDETRARVDEAVSEILGLPVDLFMHTARELAREPYLHGGKRI